MSFWLLVYRSVIMIFIPRSKAEGQSARLRDKCSFFGLSMHGRRDEPTVTKQQRWIWTCKKLVSCLSKSLVQTLYAKQGIAPVGDETICPLVSATLTSGLYMQIFSMGFLLVFYSNHSPQNALFWARCIGQTDGQRDGLQHCLMPPRGLVSGGIATSLNAKTPAPTQWVAAVLVLCHLELRLRYWSPRRQHQQPTTP